jgi:glycosyltransferase involved in cell wall biosynthesis
MQMEPLVSLVIPVFNQKHEYMRRCLESALVQPHAGLEIVVSDNCSTNGCTEFLAEITDPRLRIVKPPRHLPLIQHFAFAGFQAKGRLISFLPSDDWLEPGWLDVMLGVIEKHPEAAFAFCDINKHVMQSGEVSPYRGSGCPSRYFTDAEAMRLLGRLVCKETSYFIVGGLIRSDAYFKCGGFHDAGASYSGDFSLGLGLIKHGGAVYETRALANYTVWGEKHGKADAQRSAIACQDAAKIISWAENDGALQAIAARANFSFRKSRARLSMFFLLAYLQNAIVDPDNLRTHAEFQEHLKRLSRGWLPIWATTLLRSTPALRLMSLLRDRYGPKIKSFFL